MLGWRRVAAVSAMVAGVVAMAAAQENAVQPRPANPTAAEVDPAKGFAPVVKSDYVLQAGDVVDVTFRFTPEFNDEVTVAPDGLAVLKSVGPMVLAGKTLAEVKAEVLKGSETKLVDPEITVALKDFERPHVVVAGEVVTPGKFELRKPITALQAILLAGGPKEGGAMGRVVLFRRLNTETAEVHVLKLSRFDAKTRAKNDLILQPDDMILVQRDNQQKLARYIRLVDLGIYLNPIGAAGIF